MIPVCQRGRCFGLRESCFDLGKRKIWSVQISRQALRGCGRSRVRCTVTHEGAAQRSAPGPSHQTATQIGRNIHKDLCFFQRLRLYACVRPALFSGDRCDAGPTPSLMRDTSAVVEIAVRARRQRRGEADRGAREVIRSSGVSPDVSRRFRTCVGTRTKCPRHDSGQNA